MTPLCRCGRAADLFCACGEAICAGDATRRPVCAACGAVLVYDMDRFEDWLAAHLADQQASR